MAGTITSANAVLMLSVTNLFSIPLPIQGFAVDDIFDTESIDTAEVQMGVDGLMSAGFVFVPVKWNVALQADSASNAIFDQVYRSEQQVVEKYRWQGVIVLPSINTKFTMKNGVMTSYKPIPDGKRVLGPRKYQITWQRVIPAASISVVA